MTEQKGFTLVEMLVALVIGLLVSLAATQLFSSAFTTYRTVQDISQKQESLVFTVNTMIRAIREENIAIEKFKLSDSPNNENRCQLTRQVGSDEELLVDNIYKDDNDCGELYAECGTNGNCYIVTLKLPRSPSDQDSDDYEEISFHIVGRQP